MTRNLDEQNFGTISVYNLPGNVTEKEIEKLFEKYGTIHRVVLKPDSGAAVAHVQYADESSARDAVDTVDGYCHNNFNLLVVHKTHGPHSYEPLEYPTPYKPRPQFEQYKPRPQFSGNSAHFEQRGPRIPRVSDGPKGSFKVMVQGLPPSGSWQDVKDHFRRANPLSSNVDRNGMAVVGFGNKKDAEYAVRKYNESRFTSHKGDRATISVYEPSSVDHASRNSDFKREYVAPPTPEYVETTRRSRSRTRKSDSMNRSLSKETTPESQETRPPLVRLTMLEDNWNPEDEFKDVAEKDSEYMDPESENRPPSRQSIASGDAPLEYDEILGL